MGTDMKPSISVIVSTFNRKKELQRCLQSIVNQSFADLEIIVVDDCSSYSVPGVIKQLHDPRIRYIKTEANTGHDSKPKNLGLNAAQGEFVTFLDDDDEYRRDALKVMVTYARETKADVVYCDYLNHQPTGKTTPGWSLEFQTSMLQRFNFISMCSVMAKRQSVLAVGGFDEEVPKFKDWNLWLRMQKNRAVFCHVPIIVTEVHHLKESVSQTYKNDVDENGRYLPTYFDPVDCAIWPKKTILGEEKSLRVAVYTLTMNRLDYTKAMAAAANKLAGYPFDWYVIDQGSTDGTQEWIKRLTRDEGSKWRKKLQYRLYEKNVGLAKGWNNMVDWLVKEGEYDVVIKVDNDAQMMTDGWLEAMVQIFRRNRNVCLSPYVEGLDASPGGVLRQRVSGESPYLMINDMIVGIVPHLGGIVYATPTCIFDEFRFDEVSEGNKDVLLSNYANANGFNLFYMEEYRVWHIDGSKGQAAKYPDYFAKK